MVKWVCEGEMVRWVGVSEGVGRKGGREEVAWEVGESPRW